MVHDLLLERLESMPGFEIEGGQNRSCLAFADNLLLVPSDALRAQSLLDATVDYLGGLGMHFSASCTWA